MDNNHNIVDIKTRHIIYKTPGIRFSLSGRMISSEMQIDDYIKIFYMYTEIKFIENVYGHLIIPSPLYGGRTFKPEHSLTLDHVRQLEQLGIGLSLTMTNHFFDDSAYKQSHELLNYCHRKGNSIICVNDKLALRLRNDYPNYVIRASIIKNINTIEKIDHYLNFYHELVLPMNLNNDDFLKCINRRKRERVVLFANATCAYNCTDRTCYRGFSQMNAGKKLTVKCSQKILRRLDLGDIFFDVKKFKEMGFIHFKLLPLAPSSAIAAAFLLSGKHKEQLNEPDNNL